MGAYQQGTRAGRDEVKVRKAAEGYLDGLDEGELHHGRQV
jgi:hypothetical protein